MSLVALVFAGAAQAQEVEIPEVRVTTPSPIQRTPRRPPPTVRVIPEAQVAAPVRPACECMVQAPAPHHVIARGRAGPGLLAHIAVAKFDDHLPLYRQAEIYARDGVDLATSTLSGWVGAAAGAVMPLVELLRHEVITGSDVLHGDDTTVPILASRPSRTG